MFSRLGYLLVAEQDGSAARFDEALQVHRHYRVRLRRLTQKEITAIAPPLDTDRVLNAIYLSDGEFAPHHAAMAGYANACRQLGVQIR